MSSAVRRARGNSRLYLFFPAVADLVLSAGDLTTAYSDTYIFPEVKSAPFNTSTNTIDVTSWDSGDWQEVVPDIHNGSIAVTSNLILGYANFDKLVSANNKGKQIGYMLVLGDKPAAMAKNNVVVGFARITGFNLETTDVHSLSMTLTIDGEPKFFQDKTAMPKVDGS